MQAIDLSTGFAPAAPESASDYGRIPWVNSILAIAIVGGTFFGLLHFAFPVFVPAAELLAPFPPEEIAVERELAYRTCRLTNSLLAIGTCALALSVLIPLILIKTRIAARGALGRIPLNAVLSVCIACLGVFLAYLAFDRTTQLEWGMLRTFLAHWIEFSFFAAAIGLAAGSAAGGRAGAISRVERGAKSGFVAATLFDIFCVILPRIQVDSLMPGGAIWGGRDYVALGLWVLALMLGALFALPGKIPTSESLLEKNVDG